MPDLDASLPIYLRERSRVAMLAGRVPALLAHPDGLDTATEPAPLLLWMHGRTVDKFLDPGRYLRLLRGGIGVCAIDLPGHGARFDASLQRPEEVPRLVQAGVEELDAIVADALAQGPFDPDRVAIGGMSAGGMIALARLALPHAFRAGVAECSSGSWQHLSWWPLAARIAHLDPASRAECWIPVPLLLMHNEGDEWIPLESQRRFAEAIRPRYADPSALELEIFRNTGAPAEHAGFGRFAAAAKERLVEFLARHLRG